MEIKDDAFVAGVSIVEIKGDVLVWDGINFELNGLTILASGAELDGLPNGLANGIRVEVEGTYNGFDTITANKVQSEELELDDSEEFEVEGLITGYVDNANFTINGFPVDASAASFSPAGITLGDDLQVEAEGPIVNGVLKAEEIKLRGGDVKISAYVSEINDDTFTASPVSGQPAITITLGTETEIEDEINENESLNISNLLIDSNLIMGDFVEIEGFETGIDSMFASQVKIVNFADTDGVEIQANIQETTDGDDFITILGINFPIDLTTVFKDSNDTEFNGADPENEFNTAASTSPLISITDSEPDGFANTVEIE